MIKLQIIGRLSSDAVVREYNGKKFLSFSVYHSRKVGENEWKSTFVNCTYNTEKADEIAKWLVKGKAVFVEGEPRARAYTAKDGSLQASLELAAREFQFVSGDKVDNGNAQPNDVYMAQEPPIDAPMTNDLPF